MASKASSGMFINKGDRLEPLPNSGADKLLAEMPKAKPVRMQWLNRSYPHHNMFFAVIGLAFKNWPELFRFQPTDAEHLRAWLLCEAGHRELLATIGGGIEHMTPVQIAAFTATVLAQAKGRPVFFPERNGTLYAVCAKSIAKMTVGQPEFNELSQKVSDILAEVTGLNLHQWKMMLKEKEI